MPFSERSHLISPELEAQLGLLFAKLTGDVQLFCIPGDDEKSREMVVFLNHLVSLTPRLSLRVLTPGEDAVLDQALDPSLLPATGVGGPLPRMVFHGVPGGKEMTAFAAAILNAGGGAKEPPWLTRREIETIQAPMKLQVLVSLACSHCAQLVANAQRIAWENPLVTAHMIDANLYPELVAEQKLDRVPMTVVNGRKKLPGGRTLPELAILLRKRFL